MFEAACLVKKDKSIREHVLQDRLQDYFQFKNTTPRILECYSAENDSIRVDVNVAALFDNRPEQALDDLSVDIWRCTK